MIIKSHQGNVFITLIQTKKDLRGTNIIHILMIHNEFNCYFLSFDSISDLDIILCCLEV